MNEILTQNKKDNYFTGHFSNRLVFFVLEIIIFIAGYWQIKNLGLYGDDWGASTFLFHSDMNEAVKEWWQYGSGEISNFRMLAVMIPVLWFYAFKLFGLIGISFLNFVVYLSLSYFLFLLLKQKISNSGTLFGALLFALYPTNNAYLWQVTMSYAIALLAVFAACLFFSKQKWFLSLIFLLISIFINEGVFFIFFISLLPSREEGFSWPILKQKGMKWLVIVLGIVIIYVFFRVTFELKGITGGNRTVSVLHNFNLAAYIFQFVKSYGVVLLISFSAAVWKIYFSFKIWHLAVGVAVFLLSFVLLNFSKTEWNQIKNRESLIVMLMGLMLIIAGRYYGFYYVPSINVLNLDTRYYFAASVGGAVFFAGFFEYLQQKLKYQKLIIILACTMFGMLAIFRFEVQKDYADSFKEAKNLWKQLVYSAPAVPENSLVVVNIPDKILGKPVGLFEAAGDLRITTRKMYNKRVDFVSSPFIQHLKIDERLVCLDSAPIYNSECFNKDKVYIFEWKNNQLGQVAGTALQAESGGVVQKIPDNFRRGILK